MIFEAARGVVLTHLDTARQILGEVHRSLRIAPDDDRAFESLAEALHASLGDAGAALQHFHDLRECRGTA